MLRLLIPALFTLVSALPTASAQTAIADAPAWLFTSFRGSGDGLHLAASTDGLQWTDLNQVFLKPSVGSKLMRDPHILRGPDGVYRLVWTTGWKDKGIGYASSTDLIHWSAQQYLPFFENVAGAHNAWAPETIYDAATGQYVITWSSDIDGRFPETRSTTRMNNRTYYVTTKDFASFSEPELFLDPGFDHIDTTVKRVGDNYIAVFKEGDQQGNGTWGPIHWAVGNSVLGPYKLMPKPLVKERAEGPTLVEVGGKTLLYVDYYSEQRYGVYETVDWKSWTKVSTPASVVKGQRHGTIFSVTAGLVQTLAAPAAISASASTRMPASTPAPKPILDGFTADPAIRVFGDTYYLYPTSDKPNWQTTDFSVWSSKNLVEWKKEGMILDVTKDLKWANIEAWAPDIIERNGTYYFYFCAKGMIGVATAKTPVGPFVDALGKPLLVRNASMSTNTIDPYPFIDDDGQAYLYFGNGGERANVFKLKPDMVTLDGEVKEIPMKNFREGVVVFKRQGKYYFMWSIDDARSPNYRVGWGTADSPLGPVKAAEKDFIVLQKNGAAVATAHHSVVNVPGTDRWYVAYHRHAIADGNGYKRETNLVRMEFNPDGSIKPMDPLTSPFKPGDVGEPIVNGKGLAEAR